MDLKSNQLGLLTTKIGSGITPRGGQSVYQNFGTHLIRSQNIYNHKFEKNGLVCISQEIADKMKSVEIMKDDVLINITGDSVARAYLVPNEVLPARVNQHVCILRTAPELNPHYLYYYLINPVTQNHLLRIAGSGGTRNALTKSMLFDLIIKYPEIKIQEKVVNQLNTIKNQIITLQNQNQILEQMAQAIFQSWFVDFDGVTEFEDSELGKIPKGWKIEKLQELCVSIQNGGTPKRKESEYWENGTIEWYKTGELLDKFLLDSEEKITKNGLENSSVHLWPENTILFAIYAFPVVGRMGILTKPGCSNQAASGLIPKKEIGVYFLFLSLVFTRSFLGRIATGAAQQNISQEILKKHTLILPPIEIISKFNDMITPIFEQMKTIQIQIQTLTKIRDALLPKLMSGEIRV